MLAAVARLAAGRLVLIGVGGIATGREVLEKIRAGASLVQLYTGFALHGPALIPRLKRELLAALDEGGFATRRATPSAPTSGTDMQHLHNFAPLAARYDGFVLDLWGVIHDGVSPYPGAVDCLERLRAAGKRVVLLSNAPRRAADAAAAMRAMGIGDALYTGIVTSGEATHALLRDRSRPGVRRTRPAAVPSRPGARPQRVRRARRRERGRAGGGDVRAQHRPRRQPPARPRSARGRRRCVRAARRGLPMVCANPDLEVIRGGERVICAGALALRYAALGGDVLLGRQAGPGGLSAGARRCSAMPKARVLAVGDALRTDIAGAAAAGLDAAWVLGGIHGAALVGAALAGPDAAEAMARRAGLAPLATLPALRW